MVSWTSGSPTWPRQFLRRGNGKFTGELDFAKLTGGSLSKASGALEKSAGAIGKLEPNTFVWAFAQFPTFALSVGQTVASLTFGLTYTTPELFGMKEFLTLTGGWLQPQKEFIEQPLSKLFMNNTFESSKGIGANIPFSSSFSTWGGTLKLKPIDWYYAQGGSLHVLPTGHLSRQSRACLRRLWSRSEPERACFSSERPA